MKQLRRPVPVGSTGTLPRTANTSRNSSRSTSPCSSSVSGSSGIPRSVSSSNAGSRDRAGSRLQAPSTPSTLRARTDSPATLTPSKSSKTPTSVPGSPAVNSIPRRSHLTPKNTNSLTRNGTKPGLPPPSTQTQNNNNVSDSGDAHPPTSMMDKFKIFREKGPDHSDKTTAPVSKLASLKPKVNLTGGLTLSRKEVEAAVESSLKQTRSGKGNNSVSPPNSAPVHHQSSDNGPPRPHHPATGFGFPGSIAAENDAQQHRSSRVENKAKPAHRISSPRHNARSASSHLRAPTPASQAGGSSQIAAPRSTLPAPIIKKPSIEGHGKSGGTLSTQGTPRTSRRAAIPSVSSHGGESGSRYGSLSRRKASASSNGASLSRDRSTASSNEALTLATTPDAPVPVPPPRGTSKLSSVANVPYPAGITGPQTEEQPPSPAKPSSNSRSGRQKARALYNAVKQREDSRTTVKDPAHEEPATPTPPSDERVTKEPETDPNDETLCSEEPETPSVKPMAPLNCSAPNSYLQFLGTRRPPAGTPKHLALSRLGDNDTSESGTPMSEGSSQMLDISGYMSDCGVNSDSGGHRWAGGYNSDQGGYLSEGGYTSDIYAGRIQRRFKEGLRAVEESLQSTQDVSCSDADLGLLEDDVSSISSGNLSDPANELTSTDETSLTREPNEANQKVAGVRRVGGGMRSAVPPLAGGMYPNRRNMYGQRMASQLGGSMGGRTGPVCYSSDVEENSPYACHNSFRKYASDVEGDYNDLDISSSCSMDLLSGRLGSDYYFSDTESLITRPPLPRPGGRKSDAGLHTDQSTIKYLRKMSTEGQGGGGGGLVVSTNCPMHNARLQAGGGVRRPSPDGLGAFQRQQGMSRAYGGNTGPGGITNPTPPSSRMGLIRAGAGQASAMDDLDLQTGRLDQPVNGNNTGFSGGLGGQLVGGGSGSSLLLSNVKLPYAIGVKNSYSNSSLSRNDLTDDMDVKGSHLSLVSIGSCRSINEERQTQEIRKLRVDLELAQQKVTTLSTQLTTNAHVVSAFDHNLASMTARLQSLNATTEKKENEIMELKSALESLKKQNVMMNGGLSGSPSSSAVGASGSGDNLDGSLRSAESLTSLNSNGSGGQEGKRASKESKEKKTGWLRHSFGKAFKKKTKGGGQEMDAENYQQAVDSVMAAYGATAAEAEELLGLKRELEEKDLRLTDVQLEALASTQQLEQLRDMMEKMKSEMTTLKTDNDRLQRLVRVGGSVSGEEGVRHPGLASLTSQISGEGSPETSDLKKKLSLDVVVGSSQGFDLLFGFPVDEGGKRIPVSVHLPHDRHIRQDHMRSNPAPEARTIHLGMISISSKTKWECMDACVGRLLREYVGKVDPLANLGLNGESIQSYNLSDTVVRCKEYSNPPDVTPFGYLSTLVPEEMHVSVSLKGSSVGGVVSTVAHNLDTLAFDTLIPKTVLHRYICLLLEHQRIMLCGPSGTGKTFLANRLADFLVARSNRCQQEGAIATFNVDHKSSKELRTYLSNLAEQIDSNRAPEQLPTVIILDNLHHVTSLAEVFNSFLSVKHQRSPYIIGTMNQSTTTTTNLQLHHNFRWVLCTNHMEPVKGFLGRFLRRKLIQFEVEACEHHRPIQCIVEWIPLVWQHLNRFLENFSSADVTIGPRLFLGCPMDPEASKVWFTDLWNYSLVPYLLEAVREGLQLYGRRGPWEDPADWLIKTWPWDSPPSGQDWSSLLRLRPEDVGYDLQQPLQLVGNSPATSKRVIEQIMTSSTTGEQGEQLVNMLMRLQEAANSSNSG